MAVRNPCLFSPTLLDACGSNLTLLDVCRGNLALLDAFHNRHRYLADFTTRQCEVLLGPKKALQHVCTYVCTYV